MRPYKELCRVESFTELRLIKIILNKYDIEYFVQGDPFNFLLLPTKSAIRIMVKYDELEKAKDALAVSN